MALFYNNTQSIWPGLPPLSRPYPTMDSQQFSGTSAMGTGNTPMQSGPVTPPRDARRRGENWTGLPPIQKYGR